MTPCNYATHKDLYNVENYINKFMRDRIFMKYKKITAIFFRLISDVNNDMMLCKEKRMESGYYPLDVQIFISKQGGKKF